MSGKPVYRTTNTVACKWCGAQPGEDCHLAPDQWSGFGKYRGQPNYVMIGYQNDLFELWAVACDEDEKRAFTVIRWLKEELQRAWDEEWWGVKYDYDDWAGVYAAQDDYERITTSWRERAKTFKGEAALENVILGLPEWIRPGPDRMEKPDKDREQYERLRARFEPGLLQKDAAPTEG